MDTLEFELLKAHITAELADVEGLKVAPYAGQDMPGKSGEPLIALPAILIKRRQPVTWRPVGRGVKMAEISFEFAVLVKNLLSQDERLLAQGPGLSLLVHRLDRALDGANLRKGLLARFAGTPEADQVVINTMMLTTQTDPVNFSSVQRTVLTYVALCYNTNTYDEPLHPSGVTIEIQTSLTTTLTEV